MKKILLMMAFCMLLAIPCYASDTSADTNLAKSPIPVMIINNSFPKPNKFEVKIKTDLPVILVGQIEQSLSSKYQIVNLESNSDITDLASTEKSDILQLFKNTNYTVAILAEILPIQPIENFFAPSDASTTVHIKIVDIKNEKYLYNGKLHDTEESSRKAMKQIGIQLDQILAEKLMK